MTAQEIAEHEKRSQILKNLANLIRSLNVSSKTAKQRWHALLESAEFNLTCHAWDKTENSDRGGH